MTLCGGWLNQFFHCVEQQFSRYKYGTMVKGILDTLLYQKSKQTE